MKNDLNIKKIYGVYSDMLKPGMIYINNSKKRHSDAFVYVLDGGCVYTFDDYSVEAAAGDIVYLAKGSSYIMRVLPDYKFVYVDFDFEECDEEIKSSAFKNIPPEIENMAFKMFRSWIKKTPWQYAEVKSSVFRLYSECIKSHAKKYTKRNKIVSEAIDFIAENYTDPDLDLEKLSGRSGVSDVHFRRMFKSETNTTPLKYINNLKIKKARHMLANSNYSVAEIAVLSGFNDPYYFSRFFKAETGMTPMGYRNKDR